MKTIVTLLILFTLFSVNIFAQNSMQLSLPEEAKARFGKGFIYGIAYSPDGIRLALASSIGIWLYDTATHQAVALLTGHTGVVTSVTFSPDGNTIASGGGWKDATVRLWDVETGANTHTLTGHTDQANSVVFSPDGTILASGGGWEDETVRLWDVKTGANTHTLTGHTDQANSVAFSPDGNTIASGSQDNTVRLWDVKTGANTHTLTEHEDVVNSVAFSPDGNTIASGSRDNTVRLWDVDTGENTRTFTGHTHYVFSVAFSPDGNTLASGSEDGTILLWALTPSVPTHTPQVKGDVNQDGVINVQDLVLVAGQIGQTGPNDADVNGDGAVNIQDLVLVAGAFANPAAAPASHPQLLAQLTPADVQGWLVQAQQMGLTTPVYLRGIAVLEQLLAALTPKETTLLPNYPNPFNPETWIPYRLAKDAFVTLTIYDLNGQVVRTLDVGHRVAAFYESRSKAIYWDSRNQLGEQVASGVYYYHLSARNYAATLKMLVVK